MTALQDEKKKGLEAVASSKSNAWTDMGLVVPIFVGYHLGVVSLSMRNAADVVTSQLIGLANQNLVLYFALTLCLGLAMGGVFALLGRGQSFEAKRFLLVLVEASLYAVIMSVLASWVVGSLPLVASDAGGPWPGLVMSLGAGLYEEIVFRAGLYGVGALLLRWFVGPVPRIICLVLWAVVASAVFSGWHYIGPYGDPFQLKSFVFRWVCGGVFTAIFVFRGFAPAVWTHTLYDIWVLVL